MKKKAKYTSIARSIVQNAPDKRSWKEIELTGELEETGSFAEPVDTNGDEDIVVMDFEELTVLQHVRKGKGIPVMEYTLDGEFIRSYKSVQEVCATLSLSATAVSQCCRGATLSCTKVNRIFLYGDADIEQRLQQILQDKGKRTHPNIISIREYQTDGKLVRTWHSIKSVTEAFNISRSKLEMHLKGSIVPIKGRFFLTGTENIENRVAAFVADRQKKLEKESLKHYAEKALQIDIYTSGGEFLKTCKDSKEVVKIYNVSFSDVSNHMLNRALVTKGLMFLPHGADIQERINKVKNRKTWKTNL